MLSENGDVIKTRPGARPLDREYPRCRTDAKALAKRRRKLTQVENLGLLSTPFGQGLRALALTCDDLR